MTGHTGCRLSVCLLAITTPAILHAQPDLPTPSTAPASAALTLDEVLRTSALYSPQIVEALARIRQAEGRQLSAEGAFDTVIDAQARSRLAGFYDGSVVEGQVRRPFLTNGGEAYAGYRVTRGTFPIYEDRYYTNRLGEFKAGATFALLRDRFVDERRTRLGIAAADIDVARLESEMVAIGVQALAIDAYQAWAVAGLRLRVYQELLDLAVSRRGGIERQVELGAQPAILATENEQNIVRRRALVARTEIELETAANALSLYHRDAAGRPAVPRPERLPDMLPDLPRVPRTSGGPLPDRPDLDTILARIGQAEARLQQAENELQPRVDLFAEGARDVGPIGLGGISRDGTEAIAGVRLSVPLERRGARGRIVEARGEIDALRSRRQQLAERVAADVDAITITVEGADRLLRLAIEEAELADRMAQAERRRFGLGASDFLIVNLREEAAADARVRRLDAEYRLASARADYASITVDRAVLGLPAR